MITEFAADKLSLTTVKSTVGLTRWNKDTMISFFPLDIEGNRLKYDSGIDKVYDLFLTRGQVEQLIREYDYREVKIPKINPKTVFWEKMGKSLVWVMAASIAPIFIWESQWTLVPIVLMGIWTSVVFFGHMKSLNYD